jgi:hypothetical protein
MRFKVFVQNEAGVILEEHPRREDDATAHLEAPRDRIGV